MCLVGQRPGGKGLRGAALGALGALGSGGLKAVWPRAAEDHPRQHPPPTLVTDEVWAAGNCVSAPRGLGLLRAACRPTWGTWSWPASGKQLGGLVWAIPGAEVFLIALGPLREARLHLFCKAQIRRTQGCRGRPRRTPTLGKQGRALTAPETSERGSGVSPPKSPPLNHPVSPTQTRLLEAAGAVRPGRRGVNKPRPQTARAPPRQLRSRQL